MSTPALTAARRAVELYNREFSVGRSGISDDARALFVEQPVIVPFRAALEGVEYSGPSALDDFVAETRESWAWVRIEIDEARVLDDRQVLMTATLCGAGKESGVETSARIAFLTEVAGERITAMRTFQSEQAALGAVSE